MNRLQFIQTACWTAGLSALLAACRNKKMVKGGILGASATLGHRLRDQSFQQVETDSFHSVVIIGGGVSGLSAARWLKKNGVKDVLVLDLEKSMGGNAAFGKNAVSAFPWGAHYVPIPNNNLTDYIAFLQECGVISGFDQSGLPVYNEYHLCFDPEERLYINGRWQEGLVPQYGLQAKDRNEMQSFLQQMDLFRQAKDRVGKEAFAIPVDQSSREPEWTKLDNITMKDWMIQSGYHSTYLHEYVNYCTRDDFGTRHDQVSAWAGIHYFAGRKGKGANAEHQDVLTWPEGNGFLVNKLMAQSGSRCLQSCLATHVQIENEQVQVSYLDASTNTLHRVQANQCILAVPQMVAARLLSDEQRLKHVKEQYHYAPWMVANILTNELTERSGASPSWDNVLFGSQSLGYVDATHQLLQQDKRKRNLTYYLPLTGQAPAEERKRASERSHAEWVELVFEDLEKIHPDIRQQTEEMNIVLWGHAMLQPRPGIIHGPIRHQLRSSIENKIHFAHTDLAGISIFEEGFYQGVEAARAVIKNLSS